MKISPLTPSTNEYVDEQYAHHRFDPIATDIRTDHQSVGRSNDCKQNDIAADSISHVEESETFEDEIVGDEEDFSELQTDRITSTEPEEEDNDEKSVSFYLLNDMDQVVETIHVADELFEAKKTSITGIQAPDELLPFLTSMNVLPTEDRFPSSVFEEEVSISNVYKTEPLLEILSNKTDIPLSLTCLDDQKPEVIIITTEETLSNVKIEPPETISSK